jgi:hypothetical protein
VEVLQRVLPLAQTMAAVQRQMFALVKQDMPVIFAKMSTATELIRMRQRFALTMAFAQV